MFPLIQLPRKSEVVNKTSEKVATEKFPLIQLPRKSEALPTGVPAPKETTVSINSTSEEVRSADRLPFFDGPRLFPLIQLPRKSEDKQNKQDYNFQICFH